MIKIEYPKGKELEDFKEEFFKVLLSSKDEKDLKKLEINYTQTIKTIDYSNTLLGNNGKETRWKNCVNSLNLSFFKNIDFKSIVLSPFQKLVEYCIEFSKYYEPIIIKILKGFESELNNNNNDKKITKITEDINTIKTITQSNIFNNTNFVKAINIVSQYKNKELTNVDLKAVNTLLSLFSYDNHSSRISIFFKANSEKLNINTCFYCNMAYINCFKYEEKTNSSEEESPDNSNTSTAQEETEKKMVRQFDLDHFIPKSKYPIVALSLFNFVPSCKSCNTTAKSDNDILDIENIGKKITIEDAIKLSPTSEFYDFDNKVKIYPVPKPQNEKWSTFFERDGEGFEVRFRAYDPIYVHEYGTLHLPERYDFHKIEALRLLELQERYSNEKIKEIIKDFKLKKTIEEVWEDILQREFKLKYNRAFSKMYKDIIDYHNTNETKK